MGDRSGGGGGGVFPEELGGSARPVSQNMGCPVLFTTKICDIDIDGKVASSK